MTLIWMVGHLLRRCHQVHTSIWSDSFGNALTAPQYAVLSALASGTFTDQQSIGMSAALDKSTVADIVRRLEVHGWLRRTEDPADGRRHRMTLTPVASFALTQTSEMIRAVQSQLLAPVAPDDRAGLIRLLQILARVEGVAVMSDEISGGVSQALVETPGHLIRRAQQVHTSLWTNEFGREITGPQAAVLRMLQVTGEIPQVHLGKLVALDKSNASDVVARLIARGLLQRRIDPEDKRNRLVTLTDDGRELTDEVMPRVESVQASLLEPIPVNDRQRLVEALSAIAFRGSPQSLAQSQ